MKQRLRASTYLAIGANDLFLAWLDELRRVGVDIEGGVGDREFDGADVIFACGLLTATRRRLGEPLSVVAAPVFTGEQAAVYRSVIITRKEHSHTGLSPGARLRLAVNEYESWSGWHGLKEHLRNHRVHDTAIGEQMLTGGHVQSIEAVLDGRADVAGIDHSVWDAHRAVDPRSEQLHVIGTTRDWPAPPISIRSDLDSETQNFLTVALLELPQLRPANASDYDFMLDEVDRHPTWP